ncbi:C39 family peptidase [Candidatus Collierbacteria bacterium]|nr:C39 family peptidase [Candidatus Collierbacteria bacterium]
MTAAVPLGIAGFVFFRLHGRPSVYKPLPEGFTIPAGPLSEEKFTPSTLPHRALLPGAKWVPQTFNNCVPATTAMVLQYFGINVSQEETKEALRTNPTDSNVFTYEMRDYLKSKHNIEGKIFYNGNLELVKALVANGFYVVVEDWLHPNEDIGHVTIIRGYDDDQGVFIADDSYIGTNITYKYDEFDNTQWKPFNREYLPVYQKDKEDLLKSIVGENWDEEKMYQNSVKQNLAEVINNPNDMHSWFNLGTSYFGLAEYAKAKEAFEKSRALGWPNRMLWYQIQPVQTHNRLGEYEKALELAKIGLKYNDSFAELYLESAIAYKGLGDLVKAREEAQKALTFAPNFELAKRFIRELA